MKTLTALLAVLLAGCTGLPSMRYCDKVEYVRDGSVIKLTAVCQAPIGGF